MLDFIKDLLGINRYHVVWKVEGDYADVSGSTREHGIAPLTKRKARALMHRFSTPGECWIERA
jgi:hypothetical protein